MSVSSFGCYGLMPAAIPALGLTLGLVHYEIPAGALPGDVLLSLANVRISDSFYNELGTCNPTVDVYLPAMSCTSSQITLWVPSSRSNRKGTRWKRVVPENTHCNQIIEQEAQSGLGHVALTLLPKNRLIPCHSGQVFHFNIL